MLVALCRKITSLSHSIAGLRDIICKRPKCFQVISTPQDKDDCYGMISSDISSTKICFLMSNHSNLKTDEIVRMIFWTNIWALCDFLQTRCLLLFMKSFSIINKVCLIQGQDKTTQYYLVYKRRQRKQRKRFFNLFSCCIFIISTKYATK